MNGTRRVGPISKIYYEVEGAPCPSLLGTEERRRNGNRPADNRASPIQNRVILK